MSRPKKNQSQIVSEEPIPTAEPSNEERRESLKLRLEQTRARRFKLQGKPYKSNDEKLMLNALDCHIGHLLLQLEDIP